MLLEYLEAEAVVAIQIAIITMVTFILWMYRHRR